jgi:hypothetical protein
LGVDKLKEQLESGSKKLIDAFQMLRAAHVYLAA